MSTHAEARARNAVINAEIIATMLSGGDAKQAAGKTGVDQQRVYNVMRHAGYVRHYLSATEAQQLKRLRAPKPPEVKTVTLK